MIKKIISLAIVIAVLILALEVGKIAFFEYMNRQIQQVRIDYCLVLMDVYTIIILSVFTFIFNNVQFYDAYWAIAPIYKVYMILTTLRQDNNKNLNFQELLILTLVSIWSFRLFFLLFSRWEGFPHQDFRLTGLEKRIKSKGAVRGFIVWWGIVVPIVALNNLIGMTTVSYPFVMYFFKYEDRVQLAGTEVLGILILIVALIFESSADFDSAQFRKNENNKNQILDFGFRRYLRYPQYLGEFLFWTGGFVIGLQVNQWKRWIEYPLGPFYIFIYLLYICKVMDKYFLQSRNEKFTEYKQIVRFAMFPFFRGSANKA